MRLPGYLASLATLSAATVALSQTAVLHDGTVVTLKAPLESFVIEGSIWNIDAPNRQIFAGGSRVTIPATLNGVEFVLGNTQIVNHEEVSLGEITAATFDRLTDTNAVLRDYVQDTNGEAGTIRFGPARSMYSTSEARGAVAPGLDRSPQTEKSIEDAYFFLVRNAYAMYPAGTLPENFLGKIGIRTETGGYPVPNSPPPPRRFWRYPASNGATLLAAGSVYVDAKGVEYKIPDFPTKGYFAHVIIAETVLIGNLVASAVGNPNTPDSFVIGETLVLLNQDPRMPMDIIGIAGAPLSREWVAANAPVGSFVAVVGHGIGEHVMFGEAIEVDGAFDPAVGGWVGLIDGATRFTPGRGLQFRGTVVPVAGNSLTYQYGSNDVFTGPVLSLNAVLVIDPLSDSATFNVRDDLLADPVLRRQIRFVLRNATTNAIIREHIYNWADIAGL